MMQRAIGATVMCCVRERRLSRKLRHNHNSNKKSCQKPDKRTISVGLSLAFLLLFFTFADGKRCIGGWRSRRIRRRTQIIARTATDILDTSSSATRSRQQYVPAQPRPSNLPRLPPSPDLREWKPKDDTPQSISRRRMERGLPPAVGLFESITSKVLAFNALTFAMQMWNPSITKWGAKLSQPILAGEQLYRLLTPVFLHGGLGHLFLNSASLKNIGPHVERTFGSSRFLATYLVSGVTGNLASAIMSPNPAVGASGAIFGLIGAYYVFLRTNEGFFGRGGERGMMALQQTMGMNLIHGLLSPNVDNWGHVGGAIGGAAMAYYFGPRLYLTEFPIQQMQGGNVLVRRMVVDQPMISMRMPKVISELPELIRVSWKNIKRRVRFDRYTSDLSTRPWRNRN